MIAAQESALSQERQSEVDPACIKMLAEHTVRECLRGGYVPARTINAELADVARENGLTFRQFQKHVGPLIRAKRQRLGLFGC
jgi:hypothetical protein